MRHSPDIVLLVEDNPSDCEVVRRSIQRLGANVQLVVATSGEEVFSLLDPARGGVTPDLMFVDLNLPDCDGREIIQRARCAPVGLTSPIVVLTTSDSPRDVSECYVLGCNGYLVKPSTFSQYLYLLGSTVEYWLQVATIPSRVGAAKIAAAVHGE